MLKIFNTRYPNALSSSQQCCPKIHCGTLSKLHRHNHSNFPIVFQDATQKPYPKMLSSVQTALKDLKRKTMNLPQSIFLAHIMQPLNANKESLHLKAGYSAAIDCFAGLFPVIDATRNRLCAMCIRNTRLSLLSSSFMFRLFQRLVPLLFQPLNQ